MARLRHMLITLILPDTVAELVVFARQVVMSMGPPNTWFTAPPIPYATVTNDIEALEKAEAAARGGANGTAAVRDLAQQVVENDLEALKGYAQIVVNNNQSQGSVIIQSSGMHQKKSSARKPRTYAAKMSATPGEVLLETKAVAKRGVSYEWQYSMDGGKTWIAIAISSEANVSVPGLTPGTTYLFRYRTWIKKVASDWSQYLSFLVH